MMSDIQKVIDRWEAPDWGPVGEAVYRRTYSRTKPDGSKETWIETCKRVALGNLRLAYPDFDPTSDQPDFDVMGEYLELLKALYEFRITPGGRQLWGQGVPQLSGALNNCWVTSYRDGLRRGHTFLLEQMMLGGGVGCNYSVDQLGDVRINQAIRLHFVLDESHDDYKAMHDAGLLSDKFTAWSGAYLVDDSREGWSDAVGDMLDTMQRTDVKHMDRVYDLSSLRPEGAVIRRFGGTASGPQALAVMMRGISDVYNDAVGRDVTPLEIMAADHCIAEGVVAGGSRRSARMSMLHWQDPYIDQFLVCKSDPKQRAQWSTNISVVVDYAFWHKVARADDEALHVFDALVQGMHTASEPGFWNIDMAAEGEDPNLLPVATNPCGEINLTPFESCNLGHINMAKNWCVTELKSAGRLMARFLLRSTLDVVNDEQAEAVQNRQRRLGLGIYGLHEFTAGHGLDMRKPSDLEQMALQLNELRQHVEGEALRYARELRIVGPIKCTTIAPTGTTAKLSGTTEGCQPHYADHFIQRVRFSKINPDTDREIGELLESNPGATVETCVYDQTGNTLVVSLPQRHPMVDEYNADYVIPEDEWSLAEQCAMLEMLANSWSDNAISYTANGMESTTLDELRSAMMRYGMDLIGFTYMAHSSYEQAPKERISEAEYVALTGGVGGVGDGLDDCQNGACPVR